MVSIGRSASIRLSTRIIRRIISITTNLLVNLLMASTVSLSGMTFAPWIASQRQDSEGGDERHCSSPLSNGNSSWRGSAGGDRNRRRLGRFLERQLARPSATRRRIGKPLALSAFEGAIGPLQIVDLKRDPVIEHEITLGCVSVQM